MVEWVTKSTVISRRLWTTLSRSYCRPSSTHPCSPLYPLTSSTVPYGFWHIRVCSPRSLWWARYLMPFIRRRCYCTRAEPSSGKGIWCTRAYIQPRAVPLRTRAAVFYVLRRVGDAKMHVRCIFINAGTYTVAYVLADVRICCWDISYNARLGK